MRRVASLCFVMGYVVLTMMSTSASAHGNHDHPQNGNDSADKPEKPPVIVDPIRPKRDVVVRDHRTPRPIVRDHRDTSNSPGGTTVTNTPVVRDHRTVGGFDGVIRDHRRPGPIVRDHRDPPVVRDHRTPKGGSIFDPLADKRRPGKIPPKPPVIPIDPGRGDGKVGPWIPIDPGRGDGKVIVRDHRDPPVVRDHRTPRPIVRDHRDTSNNSGGTTVTNTPIVRDHRTPRNPVVRDHRSPVVRDHRSSAGPVVRDHRDVSNNPGGVSVTNTPVVRDHRSTEPVIRDHRDPPAVRDHR